MFSWFRKKPEPLQPLGLGPLVDLHAHLLPGVDDGCQSEDELLTMVGQLQTLGYVAAVATPHVRQDLFPNEAWALRDRFAMLRDKVVASYPDFSFTLAAEYMADDAFLERWGDTTADWLTLGAQARHVLVELPGSMAPALLDRLLAGAESMGVTVLLAHPERYAVGGIEPWLAAVDHWVQGGGRLQMNVGSAAGQYGGEIQAAAEALMDSNHDLLLGTDLHAPSQGHWVQRGWQAFLAKRGSYDPTPQRDMVGP